MGPRRHLFTLLALAATFGAVSGQAQGSYTVQMPSGRGWTPADLPPGALLHWGNRPRVDLSRPAVRAAIPGASRLGARRLRRLRNQAARSA